MISHNHKCIFVHIPKCGGQSVEHVFLSDLGLGWNHRSPLLLRPNDDPKVGPPRLAHLTSKEYIKFCYLSKELWGKYFSFAVVRNPYSRVESFYKYLGYQGAVSFESFVCHWLPKALKGKIGWFLMPQTEYILDETGGLAVNELVRLEELDQQLPEMFSRLGIEIQNVPHVNRSGGSKKRNGALRRISMIREGVFEPKFTVSSEISWSPESRLIVNRLYQADFELLDYEMLFS